MVKNCVVLRSFFTTLSAQRPEYKPGAIVLPLAIWVHAILHRKFRKEAIFGKLVHGLYGRSRGRRHWYKSKARLPVCDFLLMSNSTISRISQCLWDIATQKSEIYVCAVLYPVSFEAFARGVPPVTM